MERGREREREIRQYYNILLFLPQDSQQREDNVMQHLYNLPDLFIVLLFSSFASDRKHRMMSDVH